MLWTGFLLGLFGGMHCIGMCGPIALAIPGRQGAATNLLHKSFYNTGRVITYTILGLFTGLIGQGFSFAGWQQGLSIFLGVFLILVIVTSKSGNLNIPTGRFISTLTNGIKNYFAQFLRRRSMGSALAMGMVNGLLPCGLVYIALAASIAGGSIKSGAMYMLVFGLGTFPIMLGVSLAGNFIGPVFRQKIYRLVPVLIVTLGLIFILRGMNLGIPYVSPNLKGSHGASGIENCEP
jgi:sulfite exporter TauE/SafE